MANCHQNNVYHVVTKAMNWTTAENECLTMNGKLSSILNEEESVFVGQLLFQHPVIARFDFTVWIGGYRSPRGSRPRFRWVDYQPFSYENFYKNQPNEVPENDCLEIFDPTYRKWANYDCERERPFLSATSPAMLKYFFLILIALHSEACTPLAPRPEPTPPPIEKVESVCKNRNEPLHVDRMDFIISGRSDSLAFDGTLEGCIAAVCEIYSKGTFFELSPRLKSCRAFTNAFSASRLPGASDAQVFFMGDNSTSAKDALTELCYQDPRCTNLDA
ncbi:hypothetical protein QR680_004638 [Steinernema hermaphroditum]|uniref:C-type lectin domain-containing protein n=1 Tax=Steinernema hermaphroditum TaxID=289476 RepID=A0AA39HPB0_9BILA|nr:hypothetical protein QR680_004638 [Steinernema hermaphroditum]